MTANPFAPIDTLLTQHRAAIGEEWLGEIVRVWNRHYPGLINHDELHSHANRLLEELAATFLNHASGQPPTIAADGALAGIIRELSAGRAKAGFKPVDTAQYMLALKHVLTQRLVRELSESPSALTACLTALDDVLDRLSLVSFEAFVEARERVIAQQSLSLLELSTPVIRLWDQVLLLPLVGVIDTARARQLTERMLEAISRYEAMVTIIDVAGVPLFDTSVARQLMKGVDAAQLLGSRIVMTGLSPEGAQTLTKLGVNFGAVISRASVRAGVAESFLMIGRRIVLGGGGA